MLATHAFYPIIQAAEQSRRVETKSELEYMIVHTGVLRRVEIRICVFCFQFVFRTLFITKGSLSYLSSPCFSKNVLQSGVGIVH